MTATWTSHWRPAISPVAGREQRPSASFDLGQKGGVLGRIAPLEGVGRGLLAAVADVAGPSVLGDAPGEVRP